MTLDEIKGCLSRNNWEIMREHNGHLEVRKAADGFDGVSILVLWDANYNQYVAGVNRGEGKKRYTPDYEALSRFLQGVQHG